MEGNDSLSGTRFSIAAARERGGSTKTPDPFDLSSVLRQDTAAGFI
jgi:hypothetical protein